MALVWLAKVLARVHPPYVAPAPLPTGSSRGTVAARSSVPARHPPVHPARRAQNGGRTVRKGRDARAPGRSPGRRTLKPTGMRYPPAVLPRRRSGHVDAVAHPPAPRLPGRSGDYAADQRETPSRALPLLGHHRALATAPPNTRRCHRALWFYQVASSAASPEFARRASSPQPAGFPGEPG
ncbi:hypothetical protein D3C76_1106390 [compost metagenome]